MDTIVHIVTSKIMLWGKIDNFYRKQIECALSVFLWDGFTFILSLLVVHGLFGIVMPVLVFAVSFSLLRQFAGGAHAQSHIYCVISTVAIFISSIALLKMFNPILLFALGLISGVGVWMLSPLENKKKRLTITQRHRNRRMSQKVLILECCLSGLCYFVHHDIALLLQISIIMVFVLQVVQIIADNKILSNENTVDFNFMKISSIMSKGFLTLCLCVCTIMVHNASNIWLFQEEVPDDLCRKIENR